MDQQDWLPAAIPRYAKPITINALKVAAVSLNATINVQPTTVAASVNNWNDTPRPQSPGLFGLS
jgi:hypothetical protein